MKLRQDFSKDISSDVEKLCDTSDYPSNHPSGIKTGLNSKVLGMFKDEACGKQIVEFVDLKCLLEMKIKNVREFQEILQKRVMNLTTIEHVCLEDRNNIENECH